MFRRIHSVLGLPLAALLVVAALSGAALSLVPVVDRARVPAIPAGTSVAALAEAVAARHRSVTGIVRRPSGAVTVAFDDGEARGVEIVDPATGRSLAPFRPSQAVRTLTQLHRAFLAGDAGRIGAALAASLMLALSATGLHMLARRQGGWTALLRRPRGGLAQRWHAELGRFAALGLMVSSVTGLWMAAEGFDLLPAGGTAPAAVAASGGAPLPVGSLDLLRRVALADLDALTFPDPADPADVYVLRSSAGEASIDPATGRVLAFAPTTTLDRASRLVAALHTGRGAWALGLVLGLCAASTPVLAGTGLAIWLRRRSARGRRPANLPLRAADTVILVGSEGNTTWGFAACLHDALTRAGHRVHTAPMNALSPAHGAADRLLILAATAGDGAAPASASRFMDRLAAVAGSPPVAVLGFGDRTFPHFCGFAREVADALDRKGWPRLMPPAWIDRQSAQGFAQWGRDLGRALGHGRDLVLAHASPVPPTAPYTLVGRDDYDIASATPVAVLRLAPADGGETPPFRAGDLLGILAPSTEVPRSYSLATSSEDGVLEICVRRHAGGLCSGFLHGLPIGGSVRAFIRANPEFRPAPGRAPLVLVGAGTGIGPLIGFVRANRARRPIHLYWGGRRPESDYLYARELAEHLAAGRLTALRTAFSRQPGGGYVQDRLAADAALVREQVHRGGQVLVCGGRSMAQAVRRVLDGAVQPLGLDVTTLRSRRRYAEDVY
ncbi:PepSY domain-containing protein [Methylobacterium sp. WSM2598]|uniref:PepSY domain-containing protein n=1 Tax=Methylobacterium sp. WSM2598 TaxID=398261 RepID=UPI000376E44C|nr:PepSY domain-containing protein [Methylobacterium sp. WSM2598]